MTSNIIILKEIRYGTLEKWNYIIFVTYFLENYLVLPEPIASHLYVSPNCCIFPRIGHDLLCMLYGCKTHFQLLMST